MPASSSNHDASRTTESASSDVRPTFKRKGKRSTAHVGIKSFSERGEEGVEETPDNDDDDGDGGVSLTDLVALRALKHKPQGIGLESLNKGEERARKRKKEEQDSKSKKVTTEEDKWDAQMQRGGLVKRDASEANSSEDEDEQNKVPRLIKQDNFQGETGTVDVDKHMMMYIEEEMQKRRAAQATHANSETTSGSDKAHSSVAEDELYRIAEKYEKIQRAAKEAIADAKGRVRSDEDKKEEGNVALSTGMLTSVPEIDLGMEVRMRNIEATERARKAMEEQRERERANGVDAEEEESNFVASSRFFHPTRRPRQAYPSSEHRTGTSEFTQPMAADSTGSTSYRRQQTATDEATLERFKSRQRNQLKR